MHRNRGRRLGNPLPLPAKTVLCGELILDPSQPQNNVLESPYKQELDIRSTDYHNVEDMHGAGSDADFGVQLLTFLHIQARQMQLGGVQIHAPLGTKYLVRNSETAFKKACRDESVREWLREHVIDEGRRAAMVVGMYTYTNASYVRDKHNQGGATLQASTGTAPAAANTTAGLRVLGVGHMAFGSQEEQIFAIEYKWVKFRMWSRKSLDDAKLETSANRWEVFFGERSKGTGAVDRENIVEFDIEDRDLGADQEPGWSEDDEDDDDDDDDEDQHSPKEKDAGETDGNGGQKSADFEGSIVQIDP